MRRKPVLDRDRGFTLLEVIVAFAILSLVLGAVLATMSGGIRGQDRAVDTLVRLRHAQSILASIGTARPLAAAHVVERGDSVLIEVAPLGMSKATSGTWQTLGRQAYRVAVTLAARDGSGPVRLETLRTGPLR